MAEKEDDHQKFTAHHDNDGSHTLCAQRARGREINSRERGRTWRTQPDPAEREGKLCALITLIKAACLSKMNATGGLKDLSCLSYSNCVMAAARSFVLSRGLLASKFANCATRKEPSAQT